jgi:hypothetical protein
MSNKPAWEGVLSQEQMDSFVNRGHVIIHDCFTPETADKWKARAWERLGYDPDDPSTWEKGRIHMPAETHFEVKEFAPKAYDAICAVMGGEDRVRQPCRWADQFIVNLHDGADRPWESPMERKQGWHVDGDWFRHFLDGHEQGLLIIAIWSDIAHQGGATYIACDSIRPVAQLLAAHPEGLDPYDFNTKGLIDHCTDRLEVTGKIGDVAILHPFILHTVSQNMLRVPRFITNPAISFNEPMNFNREDPNDFSLVERCILKSLGVDHLDFKITGERAYLNPAEVHARERERREKARLAAEAAAPAVV